MTSQKIRVSALAKELGKSSKELLVILADLGIPAKTHASSIDMESVKVIKDLLEAKPEKKEEQPAPLPPPPLPPPPPPEEKKPEPSVQKEEPAAEKLVKITGTSVAIKDLSDLLKIKPSEIIKELMKKGFLLNINQSLAPELAVQVVEQFGFKAEVIKEEEKKHEVVLSDQHKLKSRPPVVTIMGHVDHGKTKLLDAIRSSKVAESEAGGITQHIGAYQVEVKGKKITFLDTPGHEAFTALRARGAKVTDIAVLVVAADDGVMPQTVEAIDHAKAAGVPIIVAINKIDKPDANPDRIKQQLTEYQLTPEEWGGQTVTVEISAKQKKNIDQLLEMILLVAEVLELKANPDVPASGVVIESELDKGKGAIATILIKNGTLKIGDPIVIGSVYGKVRALVTEFGERLKSAPPSSAVEVFGLSDVPTPGDLMQVTDSDKEARELAGKQSDEKKITRQGAQTLESFSQHIKEGEQTDLNIIIKSDVQGSLEALVQSLKDLEVSGIHINIVHSQAGDVTESDVLLAEASSAIIVSFNTNVSPRAIELAKSESVSIRRYNIIYKVIEDIKMAMEGLLTQEYEEVVIGRGDVRATFKFSKVGVIAGCIINSGKFIRGAGLRVAREGKTIFEGKLESLKRFKEDVKEAAEGFECGVAIRGFTDFKEGDSLEVFEMQPKTAGKEKK